MLRILHWAGGALCLLAGTAAAENYSVGTLQISQPWARATPRGAVVAGAYATVTNNGQASDWLVGGSLTGASRFELHSMEISSGGIAQMRPLPHGVEIKPGQTVTLAPTGTHIMLLGLKQPLGPGQHVKGTLQFEMAGTVPVEFDVVPIGASGPPAQAGH